MAEPQQSPRDLTEIDPLSNLVVLNPSKLNYSSLKTSPKLNANSALKSQKSSIHTDNPESQRDLLSEPEMMLGGCRAMQTTSDKRLQDMVMKTPKHNKTNSAQSDLDIDGVVDPELED